MSHLILAQTFFGSLTIVVVAFGLYFLPTIVGQSRKVANVGSILVINLFLGWTVIGWVVALAMAARTVPDRPAKELGPVSRSIARRLEREEQSGR